MEEGLGSEEEEERASLMFMSQWQILLLRLKGKDESTEKFGDLPQATQRPQAQELLFQVSRPPSSQWLISRSTVGPAPDLGPGSTENEDTPPLSSEVYGTTRRKDTIAIMNLPGKESHGLFQVHCHGLLPEGLEAVKRCARDWDKDWGWRGGQQWERWSVRVLGQGTWWWAKN